jgi:hypothetical protein
MNELGPKERVIGSGRCMSSAGAVVAGRREGCSPPIFFLYDKFRSTMTMKRVFIFSKKNKIILNS